MKTVIQLDENNYYVGTVIADMSPLEENVYLMPANTIDAEEPVIPNGKKAKWNNGWVFEDIPQPEPEPEPAPLTYDKLRQMAYPNMGEYLDGIVKGDQAQIDKYIADCLAVKAKYPKPTE